MKTILDWLGKHKISTHMIGVLVTGLILYYRTNPDFHALVTQIQGHIPKWGITLGIAVAWLYAWYRNGQKQPVQVFGNGPGIATIKAGISSQTIASGMIGGSPLKRLAAVLVFAICLPPCAQAQTQKQPSKHLARHALAKVGKTAIKPFTATIGHPVRTVKQIAGSVAFAVEGAVDVIHLGFAGLDQATANEEYFGIVHLFFAKADAIAGKADTGLEKAEDYFFGRHEP